MGMFCYQCEQTAKGTGCTVRGVCGKEPEVSGLMDLLLEATKGIAKYAHRAGLLGKRCNEVDVFVIQALFATVTNVDFDSARLRDLIAEAAAVKMNARNLYESVAGAAAQTLSGPTKWEVSSATDPEEFGVLNRRAKLGEDLSGLQELVLYGLKGAAAYADHARVLGKESDEVYALFMEALDYLSQESPDLNTLLGWALKTGELNLKVMELLDAGNTQTYGHPVPTPVRITPIRGKCILVSGHDLKDLYNLLKQTENTGINVYTHGEML
ncbi:TPA: hydroxylamine reductase, partial [Candidatus Sumerlaeota bacterium]|nr:hydroxylamine reductase [Candidatus Sumerlaeota bacterium]